MLHYKANVGVGHIQLPISLHSSLDTSLSSITHQFSIYTSRVYTKLERRFKKLLAKNSNTTELQKIGVKTEGGVFKFAFFSLGLNDKEK